MRALWKISLKFGLVCLPVPVDPATRAQESDFEHSGAFPPARRPRQRWVPFLALLFVALCLGGCALPSTAPAPNGSGDGPARAGEGGPRWPAPGMNIAYRHWRAQGPVRGVIAATTGWDSDATDWTPLASGLAARGYEVYVTGRRTQWGDPRVYRGNDLRLAKRGDIDDWRAWAVDYAAFTRWVAARHPGRPLFYAAQSLGSNEALVVAGDPAWRGAAARGVFIISPGLPYMYPDAQTSLLTTLGPLFFDQDFRMAVVNQMQRDKVQLMNNRAEWQRWSHSSDRVHEGFTTRWLGETMKMGDAAREAAKRIDLPVFLYHGKRDQLLAEQADRTESDAWPQFQKELAHQPTLCEPANGNHMPFADAAVETELSARLTRWLDHLTAGRR